MESKAEALSALSEGLADAVEKVAPALVRVNGRRRWPGSGLVYAPDAVLTASHVLEREEDISVETSDGRTLAARFAGRDPSSDLAVLRVEGLEVEAAQPSDDDPRVGQLVLAVGRFGRSDGPRASLGVVGSVGGPLRTWRGGRLERYVQTDARPFPGLSGGALVDASGGVIGLLTTGLSRTGPLAIPSELAWRVAGTLSERGSVKRGYLGVLSQPVSLPDAGSAGLTQKGGLLIVGVEDGSAADRGGLMVGDIVATLDNQPVEDTEDLLTLLVGDRVGREVPVLVLRGGEPTELQVTVSERARRGRGSR